MWLHENRAVAHLGLLLTWWLLQLGGCIVRTGILAPELPGGTRGDVAVTENLA